MPKIAAKKTSPKSSSPSVEMPEYAGISIDIDMPTTEDDLGYSVALQVCSCQVPIKRVHANTWNYNAQDEFMFEKQGASLKEFGQVEPITVRDHPSIPGHLEIINGEHRWKKLSELGAKMILVNWLRMKDGARVDDLTARKLTIVLNEMGGDANTLELAQLLAKIEEESVAQGLDADIAMQAMPYDAIELDNFRAMAAELDTVGIHPEEGGAATDGADEYDSGDPSSGMNTRSKKTEGFFRVTFSSREHYTEFTNAVATIMAELNVGNDLTVEEIRLSSGERVMVSTFVGDMLWAIISEIDSEKAAKVARKQLLKQYTL